MNPQTNLGDHQIPERAACPPHVPDVLDAVHRMIVHYGLWLAQVEQQLGLEKCIEIERAAWEKSAAVQMTRLGKILGFEVDENGVPAALKDKSPDELKALLDGLSANWLANDGIWFQAV